MYTHHRLRYAARWNRRLIWALVILLLLALGWRAWQQLHAPARAVLGKLV
jgi:hypothetical protein